jgi:hypothetical protein
LLGAMPKTCSKNSNDIADFCLTWMRSIGGFSNWLVFMPWLVSSVAPRAALPWGCISLVHGPRWQLLITSDKPRNPQSPWPASCATPLGAHPVGEFASATQVLSLSVSSVRPQDYLLISTHGVSWPFCDLPRDAELCVLG